MKLFKKLASVFLSLVLLMNLTPVLSGKIYAEDAKTKTYSGENYKVDYSIKDSWDKTQLVEVKLTNTGTEDIENWALKYAVSGSLENLWGASVDKYDNDYIFQASSYNLVLKPNQSVTYGYKNASGAMALPDKITLSSKRCKVTSDFKVNFVKVQDYYDESKYEIQITNNKSVPIKMWELSFEANFNIKSIVNSEIKQHENGMYLIKSSDSTQIIKPKSTIKVSINCNKSNTNKIAKESLSEVLPFASQIYLMGMQNQSKSIDLIWMASIAKGKFDILSSVDGVKYSVVSSVNDADEYTFSPDNANSKYYFKIGQTLSSGQYFESNVISFIKGTNGFELVFEDADGDKLPNSIEEIIGTDVYKVDSDGDKLSDYDEYYFIGTNPLKKDTDGNGITDDLEDSDTDGLTNYKEIVLKTQPQNPDTDSDGLNDGSEVQKYLTNPLVFDTDGDKVGDGDETILGLNPLNPNTFGKPDSEYTINQTISNDVLKSINENNLYNLDIEVNAAGNANNNISVNESPYGNSLVNNDAILGKVVEIKYENFKLTNATLKFTIPENNIGTPTGLYNDAGLQDVQRFQVFKYDEQNKALLPVKTEFDTEKNTLSVSTIELGSYCLVDLDRWFYGLGISAMPEQVTQSFSVAENYNEASQPAVAVRRMAQENEPPKEPITLPENYDQIMQEQINAILGVNPMNRAMFATQQVNYNRQIDLVFAIDTSGSMGGTIETCKQKMATLVSKLYSAGITANIALVSFEDIASPIRTYKTSKGNVWAKTPAESQQLINQLGNLYGGWENHLDVMETVMNLPFRKNALKFSVLITDEPITLSDNNCYQKNKTTTNDVANALKNKKIITSVVSHSSSTFEPLYEVTRGIQTSIYGDFYNYLYTFILGHLKDNKVYTYVGANDLSIRMLDQPLICEGEADSDTDGLTDWQETDSIAIQKILHTQINKDELPELPTFYQYLVYANKADNELFKRLDKHYQDEIANIKILPILSDPMNIDGDNDGYKDKEDPRPLICDVITTSLKDKKFVEIWDGTTSYYGGDQDWYSDKVAIDGGCGTVAAANITAYMARHNPNYSNLYAYDNLSKENFLKHMNNMYEYLSPYYIPFVNVPFGIWPLSKFEKGVKKFAKSKDVVFNGVRDSAEFNTENVTKYIVKGLKADAPIAMLIGVNGELKDIKIERPDGSAWTQSISEHWVVITEITEDKVKNTTTVKVSTWGASANLDLDSYIDGESIYECLIYFQ